MIKCLRAYKEYNCGIIRVYPEDYLNTTTEISVMFTDALLIMVMMVLMVTRTRTCGPGFGIQPRQTNLDVITRQPDVPEETASGKFEQPLRKNDTRLKRLISTQIVFADNKYDSNVRKAIEPCKNALYALADVVDTHWAKKYKLRVQTGYMERADKNHKKSSLHLEGRAFDLELIAAPGKRRLIQRSPNSLILNLPRLAGLAFYQAGFTFVEVKNHHIHVSCRKDGPSKIVTIFSRCFPGDAYVRNENREKILIKDLKIGEKVATLDSEGKPVYSEIAMMMHRQSNAAVDDYVKILTGDGDEITLSSYHLIPVSTGKFVFSKDVRYGDELLVYDSKISHSRKSRVTHIEHVTKIGAYAPLSLDGTLLVNDVYVSCYALFPSHTVSHIVFSIWRTIYKYLSPLVVWSTNNEGYHWYPNVLRTAINYLPILPYEM